MFGCGYAGTHLAAVNSSNALMAAVGDSNVTCIKLAPRVFVLTAPLTIDRTLALVAEEGRATLAGNESVQLIMTSSHALLVVHNLELSNGRVGSNGGGAISNVGVMKMYACTVRSNMAMFVRAAPASLFTPARFTRVVSALAAETDPFDARRRALAVWWCYLQSRHVGDVRV